MSHLRYFSYPGHGQRQHKTFGYQQAVKIGDKIEIAGQGGWDTETGEIHKEASAQIDQAFKNVDVCLKDAGGKGWDQVYRVTSYHLPLNNEALEAMMRNMKKWMPNHEPIWSCFGVAGLGLEDMKVEIEVAAHTGGP